MNSTSDTSLEEAKQKILKALPSDGSSRGNISIRQELQMDEELYWRARLQLMEEGVVIAAQGRGGATAKRTPIDKPRNDTVVGVLPADQEATRQKELNEAISTPHVEAISEPVVEVPDQAKNAGSPLSVITSISIQNFKRIDSLVLPLGPVTFLVGGNNSGKSSALQAIHTAICCARESIRAHQTVIPEQSILYSPSGSFPTLGHNEPYTNSSSTNQRCRVKLSSVEEDESDEYSIELYRARNHGNIGVERSGKNVRLTKAINEKTSLFSVYVPGLSGIRHSEEFISYPNVLRMVAGGESNLVFRNVLRILWNEGKIEDLGKYIAIILGEPVSFWMDFEEDRDVEITVKMSTGSSKTAGTPVPIEMWGTGVLQIIQIFSYALLFKPRLLLIDEPDSHVHPSAQKQLMKALHQLTQDLPCQVILATHSRHLISERDPADALLWIKSGELCHEANQDIIPVLMDLGALDSFDSNHTIFLFTEDEQTDMLESVVDALDTEHNIHICSVKGLRNYNLFRISGDFLNKLPRSTRKIFHRDRDFLTNDEVEKWKQLFNIEGLEFFVPKLCDIEAYYCSVEHISTITTLSHEEADKLRHKVIEDSRKTLRDRFTDKRRDANSIYYPNGGSPLTDSLWPKEAFPSDEQIYGKDLLKRLNIELRKRKDLGRKIDLTEQPPRELIKLLEQLINRIANEPYQANS